MHFVVEWPDGERDNCYSPSYIIEEHLAVGEEYEAPEFLKRVTAALHIASERVRERYGFACSSALDQLAALEARVGALSGSPPAGRVKVVSFEKHAPRDARAIAHKPEGTQ
jgi:uncharacterized repeat protein (TIGR04042 family)